jgi:hypothetical protein
MSTQDLSLDAPGTLSASAEQAKRYRFLLVAASAGVAADTLTKSPEYKGKGLILSRDVPDQGGKAELDLAPLKDELRTAVDREAADGELASFVVAFPGEGDANPAASAGPRFKVDVGGSIVEVTVDVDPNDPKTQDDKITLMADDGSYEETLAVKDDVTPGDAKTTLRFKVKDPSKPHSLQVDPGKEGQPYFVVVGKTFKKGA